MIPQIARAAAHVARPAVVAPDGTCTYGELLAASDRGAALLRAGRADLAGERVAFLAPPGCAWVTTLWSIWRAGGVAVPLSPLHPEPELAYLVADSGAAILVAHPEFAARLAPLAAARGIALVETSDLAASPARARAEGPSRAGGGAAPDVEPARGALLAYTSGTTSRPKGVLHTHASLAAQMRSLERAWAWTPEDRILSVLPLHHVHGIVNVVGCALWSGAVVEIVARFEAAAVWDRFAAGGLTLFMAVPTIYARLLAAHDEAPGERGRAWAAGAQGLRLMVSGSAPLPASLLCRWERVTGHRLLERYGMTETGMILSNPLQGERLPGTVGSPLPGVEVRLVGEAGQVLLGPGEPAGDAGPGEVEVRGPGLFAGYWGRPEATREVCRDGGWFATGDVALVEGGRWRLLGRASQDIVKTGGYKVSALEVEEVLRGHPDLADAAVVGLPDPEWGERLAAIVVAAAGSPPAAAGLRAWLKERLAPYKVPVEVTAAAELPRNALGKVDKAAVRRLLRPDP